MSRIRRTVRPWPLALATVLAWGGALQAQAPSAPALAGRVVDGEGRPVGGVVVAAHRVTATGGGEIARATTDEDGRFELPLEATGDGVYFAATRYGGGLYVGAPVRDPRDAPRDYVIVVGGAPAAAVAPPGGPPAPDGSRWPLAAAIALAGASAVLAPLVSRGRRVHAVRSLLHDLAALEERHAAAGDATPGYVAEREALRARLRKLTRSSA